MQHLSVFPTEFLPCTLLMIEFILNNKPIRLFEKSGMTLLDFIRENNRLKGTKIGCREGDCGACTVLVGTLEKEEVTYQSITSCISPLGNANGKHIVTIEGINLEKKLNVAQQVMADNFATQCGFCTPGFVVSMTGFALKMVENTNTNTCTEAISGNICRCTGYKSIEKATNDLEAKLATIQQSKQLAELIREGFIPDYFSSIPEKLKKINFRAWLNRTEGNFVANGTDLYVRQADALSEGNVNLVGEITILKGIAIEENRCKLGASTTVTEIAENESLQKIFPKLKAYLKLVSSEQIRNMGTLGGNFVNASPIGDMSIFFLALNSTLHILGETEREIPFQEFHQDYKKYDLQKEEILTAISFEIPDKDTKFNFEKVSKRTHLDIASVNSAAKITVKENTITVANISIGGVAAIPKFLVKTNAYLKGKTINIATVKEAEKVLQSEIAPISDVRGTNIYKRLLARQLFFAHFVTLYPEQIDLPSLTN